MASSPSSTSSPTSRWSLRALLPGNHPRRSYKIIYLAVLLLSMAYAATLYINSNFLALYFSPRGLEFLYILGAVGNLIGLALGATVIRRWGNFKCLMAILIAEAIVLLGLTIVHNVAFIGVLFIFHQMLPPLALFSFDVVVERAIDTQTITGSVRSLYLTASNMAFVLVPFFVGSIAQAYSYRAVYAVAGILIVGVIIVVDSRFSREEPQRFRQINIVDSVKRFPSRKGLLDVYGCDFLLQCFYALMTIFTPLYLHLFMGFDWQTIGIILAIMLVPFVIFEAPLGRLFDHLRIERDTIMTGFLIMTAACALMFLTHSHNPVVWAILLFISRIGASFVEVGSEYSFFRRVNASDAGFISVFRSSYPLAYIIGPLALALLGPFPSQTAFALMTLVTFIGIFVAYKLPARPRRV